LELAGFILLYISTILGLDIPGQGVCVARPLTLNIGFMLVVSNIVAKNFRVYRIFHNIYVTKRVIPDSHLLKMVGTIMFVNIVSIGPQKSCYEMGFNARSLLTRPFFVPGYHGNLVCQDATNIAAGHYG